MYSTLKQQKIGQLEALVEEQDGNLAAVREVRSCRAGWGRVSVRGGGWGAGRGRESWGRGVQPGLPASAQRGPMLLHPVDRGGGGARNMVVGCPAPLPAR